MDSRSLLIGGAAWLLAAGVWLDRALPEDDAKAAVVFVSDRDGGGIFVTDDLGGDARALFRGEYGFAPTVSPDGKRVAFVGLREEDTATLERFDLSMHFLLYVVGIDGTGLALLTKTPVAAGSVRWSPDGRSIVFLSSCEDARNAGKDGLVSSAIYRIDSTGEHEKRLTDVDGLHLDPSWSPDGKRLLFLSKRSPVFTAPSTLVVMKADGSDPGPVTREEVGVFAARWSPDGTKIAYQVSADPAAVPTPTRIVLVDADGSNRRVVADIEGDLVAWTPDGTGLLLSSRSPRLLDVKLGTAVELGKELEGAKIVGFSPDSTRVLFASSRSGNAEIGALRIKEGVIENLTHHPATDSSPCWVPRGGASK